MPQMIVFIPQIIGMVVPLSATAMAALTFVASVASAAYSQSQARRQARAAYNNSLQDRTAIVRSAATPRKLVLGRVAVGGQVSYIESTGPEKQYLSMVLASASHQVDAIEDVVISGEAGGLAGDSPTLLPKYVGKFWLTPMLGTVNQAAWADLVASSGGAWTANHRGRGIAGAGIKLLYDEEAYPSGMPPISLVMRGALAYDPRKDSTRGGSGAHRDEDPATWEYTRNPALLAYWYLRSPLGFRELPGRCNYALLIESANICDEMVVIDAGGTQQRRYLCDTVLSLDASRNENMRAVMSAMAGDYCYAQGKWHFFAGAYRVPGIDLGPADILALDRLEIISAPAMREAVNLVRGTYVDPAKGWQATDYPPVTNSTYVAEDGGYEFPLDLTLPATTDPIMAQRLAKIALERARQSQTIRANFGMTAYRVIPGATVRLTIPWAGIINKVYRVIERRFSMATGVGLTLQEEAPEVYDWNYGQATVVDYAPNTSLPNPNVVPALAGFTFASGAPELVALADGTVIPRLRVTWGPITFRPVLIGGAVQIEYRKTGDTAWTRWPDVGGDQTETLIGPLVAGQAYEVRGRMVNSLGVPGPWSSTASTTVNGKPVAPPAPASFSVIESPLRTRLYLWTLPSAPRDLAAFEIRYSANASTAWDSMSTLLSIPASYLQNGWVEESTLPDAGTWTFEIRSRNSSGDWSTSGQRVSNKVLNAPSASVPSQGDLLAALANAISTAQLTAALNARLDGIENNGAAIIAVDQAVDNLEGRYTVKIDANGYVTGYGLAVDANNATPTSSFVVLATNFSVAAPGVGSQPVFVVQTTGQTINGKFYPAGTYIDSARVRQLTADQIFTPSLAAISGVMGYLYAGQIEIQSNGASDYGSIRSYGKWWADGVNGWVMARDPNGNTFFEAKAGGNRIWLSSWNDSGINFGNGAFSVNASGQLYANNAYIRGDVQATSVAANVVTTDSLQGDAATQIVATTGTSLSINCLGGRGVKVSATFVASGQGNDPATYYPVQLKWDGVTQIATPQTTRYTATDVFTLEFTIFPSAGWHTATLVPDSGTTIWQNSFSIFESRR